LQSLQTHRAAGRTPAVFRFATDGESKNPANNQALGLPCRGKVLSFAYFFFARAKKSRSRVSAVFNSRRLVKRLILTSHESFKPMKT
jgi:hypothetical protein